jgi:hypothetical protein
MHGIVRFTRIVNVLSGEAKAYRARCTRRPLSAYLPGAEDLYLECRGRRVRQDFVPAPGDEIVFADFPKEAGTIGLIAFAVIAVAGSYLVNRLTMAKVPKDRDSSDFGPRHVFGGIQTIAQSGTPVPFVYGKAHHRLLRNCDG